MNMGKPDERLAALRRDLIAVEESLPSSECLDEGTIAGLAEGTLAGPTRDKALAHVARCALCRRAVASVANALETRALAHEIEVAAGPARRRRMRLMWMALPLTAAAVLVLFFLPRKSDDGARPVLRGSTSDTAAPVLLAPRATVARADRFVWSKVRGAQNYRLRLYDAEGSVVWLRETVDTALALPVAVKLAPGSKYYWKVEAQTEWQRWAGSDLVEFRLIRGSR
jgi:hypothetical protein